MQERPAFYELKKDIILKLGKNYRSDAAMPLPSSLPHSPKLITQSEFVDACAQIGVFLMDKPACHLQLLKLEKMIQNKVINLPANEKPKVNIVREALEISLSEFGFYPTFAKYVKVSDSSLFMALICNGIIVKDAILGYRGHGELTHAIQWFIISHAAAELNFLNFPVADIFKLLGEKWSILPGKGDYTIWDIIVDQTIWQRQSGFRCPDFLAGYIQGENHSDLSNLKYLLNKRYGKRVNQERNKTFDSDMDYTAGKKKDTRNKYHAGLCLFQVKLPAGIDASKLEKDASKLQEAFIAIQNQ